MIRTIGHVTFNFNFFIATGGGPGAPGGAKFIVSPRAPKTLATPLSEREQKSSGKGNGS